MLMFLKQKKVIPDVLQSDKTNLNQYFRICDKRTPLEYLAKRISVALFIPYTYLNRLYEVRNKTVATGEKSKN